MISQQWARERIARAKDRRDWSRLPSDFERDAVAFVFKDLKDHFCKRNEIRLRIHASKATTFAELEALFTPKHALTT